ncbi:MAG: M23 family metallopeptidase [Clostridia bacterium]|nr:M23 family metallopeptidase [Clostridia bacterium]
MKRTQSPKNEPQRKPGGCLPLVLLAAIILILLTVGKTSWKKNLDYFMRGEADVGQFYKDIRVSYLKNLTYPDFMFPLSGAITSPFGERINPISGQTEQHTGIDIDLSAGTAVKAAADGTVLKIGVDERFGNYLILSHNELYSTCYAHLEQINVAEGATVRQGDEVAVAGNTGVTTGPHLHFEIRKGEKRMNPIPFLPKK